MHDDKYLNLTKMAKGLSIETRHLANLLREDEVPVLRLSPKRRLVLAEDYRVWLASKIETTEGELRRSVVRRTV